jgi:hypothetical protein
LSNIEEGCRKERVPRLWSANDKSIKEAGPGLLQEVEKE